MSKDKKIVVITGASSGIGLKTAQKLSEDKNCITICASRNIEAKSNSLPGLPPNVILKNLDVSNEKSVISFFKYIEKKFNHLNTIINCAGYVEPKSIFETTLKNWQNTINVNLTGTFLIAKYGSILMKQNGGKIINIASTAGMSARPGWAAYAASKAGVINLSITLAEELKSYGIRVYVICPGRTATPLRKILAPDEDPQTIMQPETVADVIYTLMDNKMDVLEGTPIVVRERF